MSNFWYFHNNILKKKKNVLWTISQIMKKIKKNIFKIMLDFGIA